MSAPLEILTQAEELAEPVSTSLGREAWARLRRSPLFLVGAFIVIAFVVIAVIAPYVAPHDPAARLLVNQVSAARNQIPPVQKGFPLGGDQVGRDEFSRLLVGSRQSLEVGLFATLIGLAGGLSLGTLAGALGGVADTITMRIVDVLLAIPSLLLAVTLASLAKKADQTTLIIAVATVQIPVFARLLRGQMLSQRRSEHVLAARAVGVRPLALVFRHMLPNSLGPVIVQATLSLAIAIIEAAALSFLGLGKAGDDAPEWGQMLSNAESLLDSHAQLVFYPAGAIVIVALGFTLVGEALREALDPRNRR